MKIVNFESPMRKKIEKGKSTSFHLFIVVVDTHSTTLCPVALNMLQLKKTNLEKSEIMS